MSFVLSLIRPWIITMFIDLVFVDTTHDDWVHRLFMSILPYEARGRIIALAVMAR